LFILNPFVKLTLGFMISYLILKPLQLIIHQMDRYKKAKR
ncbi:sporulation protein, partial [Turicibacter sanguinis]|nr:sporulation protein [Turicibacter sanguinis]